MKQPKSNGAAGRPAATRRSLLRGATLMVLLLGAAHAGSVACRDNDNSRRTQNLLVILGVAYLSNPCNRIASPGATAGSSTSSALTGVGSLTGRVQTTAGVPAVSALILVEDTNLNDSTFYSSHTSLLRDGSFEISGLPIGTNYKVSVEPLNRQYYGRIDSHIDCFLNPRTFTAGWYAGDGGTAAASNSAGTTVSISSANERKAIGTLRVQP